MVLSPLSEIYAVFPACVEDFFGTVLILSTMKGIAIPAVKPECFKVHPQAYWHWTTKREYPLE